MANLEVLALDTAVPQIRAPGAGDGYSVPRDMTFASGTVLSAPTVDATNVEVTNIKAKDGTAAASIADSTGVVSITANPILSGGTANGVLYLNGSKVATSGSALVFDGTNLGIGTASPAAKLQITGGNGNQLILDNTGQRFTQIDLNNNGTPRGRVWVDQTNSLVALQSASGFGLQFFVDGNSGTDSALRLDTSGNLGLGVTPSAWFSASRVYQFGSGGALEGRTNESQYLALTANQYIDSAGAFKYIGSTFASRYQQYDGIHSWSTAPSGTAGNTITFTQAMTLDANGDLGIGTTSIPSGGASTRNVSIHNSNSAATYFKLSNGATGNTASDGFDLVMGTSSDVYLYNRENGPMIFGTNNTERARITATGQFLVGKTNDSLSVAGFVVASTGETGITRDDGTALYINRLTSDGDLIEFRQANATEGSISVSGNTVSYNPFMGSHYTEIVGTMPTLKGTVLESLDELVSNKYTLQDRLPKAKISDTVSSSAVYGVYFSPDSNPETDDGILAAALGASWVRIASGVTVQRGDLLESNGDGCAKVQSDDIIRSKTIGKVTSTTVADTYADGSYIVPCVLYCG